MSANALRTLLVCLLVNAVLGAGAARGDGEFRDYPEFRYTSALPGGGWGVTPTGEPGFEGALQVNVPVAYTPHEGFIIGYSSGSHSSSIELGFSGPDLNGTATVAAGFGKPGHGIYLCEMGTGRKWEPADNVQVQLRPEGDGGPAIAIGVQDVFGHRDRIVGDKYLHRTESPYLVATQQVTISERPAYLTLGLGLRRFSNSPFAGVSYRAADSLTVFAEHDCFNINAGAAYDLSPVIADYTTLFAALVDLERPVIGLTYVYR